MDRPQGPGAEEADPWFLLSGASSPGGADTGLLGSEVWVARVSLREGGAGTAQAEGAPFAKAVEQEEAVQGIQMSMTRAVAQQSSVLGVESSRCRLEIPSGCITLVLESDLRSLRRLAASCRLPGHQAPAHDLPPASRAHVVTVAAFSQGQAQAERLKGHQPARVWEKGRAAVFLPQAGSPKAPGATPQGPGTPREDTAQQEAFRTQRAGGSLGRRDPRSSRPRPGGLVCRAGSLQVGEPGTWWARGGWVVGGGPRRAWLPSFPVPKRHH